MAGKRLSISLILNDKDFQTNLRKSTQKLKRFGKDMQRLGDDLSRNVSLPILAIGAGAVKLASDLEETDNKFRTVFSSIEGQAIETAQAFQKEFFLAEETAKNLLGSTGDLLVGFGFTEDAALGLSDKVNRLAADLASFQNIEGGAAAASKALTKALVGETESAKALGIVIKQNTAEYKSEVAQIMQTQGVTETQAKAVANLNIAYRQSTKAIGDVSRTSGSLANQTRQLQESLKNLGGQFGKDLIPLAQSVVNVFNKISTVFSGMSAETRENVIQYGLLAAALGPVMKAFSFLSTVAFQVLRLFRFISPAISLMVKAFLTLNPVARLVTLAITGLSVALPFIIDKFKGASHEAENFKNMVSTTGDVMKTSPLFDTENYAKVDKAIKKNTESFKKFKEVAAIEPKKAGPVSATGGQTSAAPQFATDPKFFEGLKRSIVQTQNLKDLTEEVENTFVSFGGAVQQAFATALVSQDSFFEVFIENIKRALVQLAAQLAAMVIISALLGGSNLGSLMGIKDIGGFSGIGGLLSNGVSENANGGLIQKPHFGLIGEAGPEVVMPLDRFMNTVGGGGAVEVFGRLSGADILLSSDRARGNRNRTRGY